MRALRIKYKYQKDDHGLVFSLPILLFRFMIFFTVGLATSCCCCVPSLAVRSYAFVFTVEVSVTRFGTNSQLWQKTKSILQFLEGLFSMGKTFKSILAIFMLLGYWANAHCCKWSMGNFSSRR